MKDIGKAIYDIKKIDELGEFNTPIHKINTVVKIIITLIYVIKVISIKNFSTVQVSILIAYPLILFIIGKIPIKIILKKVIFVLPIIISIVGINLIIDFSYNQIIFSLLLLFKCTFSLIGSLLLIVTTGINKLSIGLRKLKVPKILVVQILMLYRYIVLMMEEGYRIKSAYELRTLDRKTMTLKDWGQIMGQMLLKSIDRSEKIYGAMKLRGFNGEYYIESEEKIISIYFLYLIIWGMALIFI